MGLQEAAVERGRSQAVRVVAVKQAERANAADSRWLMAGGCGFVGRAAAVAL